MVVGRGLPGRQELVVGLEIKTGRGRVISVWNRHCEDLFVILIVSAFGGWLRNCTGDSTQFRLVHLVCGIS